MHFTIYIKKIKRGEKGKKRGKRKKEGKYDHSSGHNMARKI
jgi:hypothetical protein